MQASITLSVNWLQQYKCLLSVNIVGSCFMHVTEIVCSCNFFTYVVPQNRCLHFPFSRLFFPFFSSECSLASFFLFSLQSDVEFKDVYLTHVRSIHNENYTSSKMFDPKSFSSDLPESIDWRNKGAVSSVKNQAMQYNIILFTIHTY